MPAGRSAHRSNESGFAERGQKLVQVLFRNMAAQGDFRGLERATSIVPRELDESAEAIVTSS
jgi:hypothetical protein